MSIDVGGHLRAVRTMYGLSQRELAKRAGVTNGTISLIEQNRVSPSVSSLKKVLDGVPMSLAEFFTLDLQANPEVFYPREELTDIGDRDVSLRHQPDASLPSHTCLLYFSRFQCIHEDCNSRFFFHESIECCILHCRVEV